MPAKIMLVDDEPDLLRMVGYALHHEGFEVVVAQNGREALAKFAAGIPDLILMDVMMPEMDGYEVCRQMRAMPGSEKVLIVMLSALSQISDKVAGLEAGADDYLTKPIDITELRARVKSMLGRVKRLQASVEAEPGRVLGIIGSKGGVGTTTLTLNLAAGLAKAGHSVIAMEHRGYFGTFASQLMLQTSHSISHLLELPSERINHKEINSCLVELSFGAKALLSPGPNGQVCLFSGEHSDAILSNLVTMTQFVLLDLPPLPDAAMEVAVRFCHYILMLVEPEYTSLHAGQAMLNVLSSWGIGMRQVGTVIVNRAASAAPVKPMEIREILGCDVIGLIPPMADPCMTAQRAGLPVILSQPDLLGSKNILDMAVRVSGEHVKPMAL